MGTIIKTFWDFSVEAPEVFGTGIINFNQINSPYKLPLAYDLAHKTSYWVKGDSFCTKESVRCNTYSGGRIPVLSKGESTL